MFDIGFFELMIIMAIAVLVVGPQNLPRLAKSVGKGWKEFQSTFEGLKDDVMQETDNLKTSVNVEQLEQDVSSATKIDVDVNLDLDLELDKKPTET